MLENRWRRRVFQGCALGICAITLWIASATLPRASLALLAGPSSAEPFNAVDLSLRSDETRLWFSGQPVYALREHALYPPAAYAVLWPVLGWAPEQAVRALWLLMSLCGLCIAMLLMTRALPSLSWPWRAALTVAPCAFVAAWVCLGLGQMTWVLLAVTLGALRLVWRPGRGIARSAVLIALLLVVLVKPSIGLPVSVLALTRMTGRERGALLIAYAALTLLAAAFQPLGLFALILDWQRNAAAVAASNDFGYANLHWLLTLLGAGRFNTLVSLLVLAAYAAWVILQPERDWLTAVACCGIVARVWTYHASYDDVLIWPAIVALSVGAARDGQGSARRAGAVVLAAVLWLLSVEGLQARGYALVGDALNGAFLLLWIGALGVLLTQRRPSPISHV